MVFWKMKYVLNEEITFNDVQFVMHLRNFKSKMDQLERSTDESKEIPLMRNDIFKIWDLQIQYTLNIL